MCYAGHQLTDDYDAPIWPTAWVRSGPAGLDEPDGRMGPGDADASRRMADHYAAQGLPEYAAKQALFTAIIAARVA